MRRDMLMCRGCGRSANRASFGIPDLCDNPEEHRRADRYRIEGYRYFSLKPSFSIDRRKGDEFLSLVWWRFRIVSLSPGLDIASLQVAEWRCRPPVYHKIIRIPRWIVRRILKLL